MGLLLFKVNCRGNYRVLYGGRLYTLKNLLDHIAEFLLFLSDAPSFWFTVNTSYDQAFHPSRRFGLCPLDYECLLAAANLAHYTQSGKFAIKPMEWKTFLDGHYSTVVEGIDE